VAREGNRATPEEAPMTLPKTLPQREEPRALILTPEGQDDLEHRRPYTKAQGRLAGLIRL